MAHLLFIEASITGAGALANELATADGHEVTLVCRSPQSYDSEILRGSSEVVQCETNDIRSLSEQVREIHACRPIHGITTTADFYVPQAAFLARELGLPGLDYEAVLGVRNKYLMRLRLEELQPGLNPRFAKARNLEEARITAKEWGFPFIAKPQDGNDSENVERIESLEQLERYMKAAESRTQNWVGQQMAHGALLEELVEGPEYSIETLQSSGGPLQLIGVTAKVVRSEGPARFVEDGHAFPVRGPLSQDLFRATRSALESLRIDCGVIHTECKRTASGELKIMEVNPRLAGGKIGSHMVEVATGQSAVQAVIDIALGKPVTWSPRRHEASALYFRSPTSEGIFQGVRNRAELESIPGVVEVFELAKRGSPVGPPWANRQRAVAILTRACDVEAALQLAHDVAARAEIALQPIPEAPERPSPSPSAAETPSKSVPLQGPSEILQSKEPP